MGLGHAPRFRDPVEVSPQLRPRGQAEVLWLGGQARGQVGLAGDAGSEEVEAVVGGDES